MEQHSDHLDILAFGAHPDDVELGCGGTLVKLAAKGYRFGIVDMTQGEMGTRGTVSERQAESQRAAAILQASFRENLNIPDTRIEMGPENRRKVIDVIRRCRPQLIFVPFAGDRHPDHAHAAELVKTASFYAGVKKVDADLAAAAFRPAAILYYMITNDFTPSFMVDISQTFATKIDALKAHASQFYNPDYPGEDTFIASKSYFESIEFRARYFGWKAGVAYAEPFLSETPLLIDDPLVVLGGIK